MPINMLINWGEKGMLCQCNRYAICCNGFNVSAKNYTNVWFKSEAANKQFMYSDVLHSVAHSKLCSCNILALYYLVL